MVHSHSHKSSLKTGTSSDCHCQCFRKEASLPRGQITWGSTTHRPHFIQKTEVGSGAGPVIIITVTFMTLGQACCLVSYIEHSGTCGY